MFLLPQSWRKSHVIAIWRNNTRSYPDYGFVSHVGYGTAAHRSAIASFGVTPLHRLSIAPLAKYRAKSAVDADQPTVQPEGSTRRIGDASETVAALALERLGYRIVERNWKTKWCEIDIIATNGTTYYFVEVKHRRTDSSGNGLEAITPTKLRQMSFAAELYTQAHKLAHFDRQLIAISTTGSPPVVTEILPIS